MTSVCSHRRHTPYARLQTRTRLGDVPPASDVAIHGTVAGRVQGVAFRWYTAREASQLGLNGWVRNLPDGKVEVWVQGPSQAAGAMRSFLAVGPPAARVDSADLEFVDPDPVLRSFEIR